MTHEVTTLFFFLFFFPCLTGLILLVSFILIFYSYFLNKSQFSPPLATLGQSELCQQQREEEERNQEELVAATAAEEEEARERGVMKNCPSGRGYHQDAS